MRFSIDLSKISLDTFYAYIKERDIFQSQKVLKDNIDLYKEKFQTLGYNDVKSLFNDIKTSKKCVLFADKHDLSEIYINILRRHIQSFIPKPRKLAGFSFMDEETIKKLHRLGIKTNFQLFDQFQMLELSFPQRDYLEAIKELTRLRYVAEKFTDLLYASGFKTIGSLREIAPEVLQKKINAVAKETGIVKVNLGISDAKFLVDDAILFEAWYK